MTIPQKTVPLPPGVYGLHLESTDYTPFQLRLYVLSGEIVKVSAHLASVTEVRKP